MKLTYRPEIDGLRAIAVGAVILYHAQITILGYQPFKGGFIGVDIFFVISGYLITSVILKELVTTGSFSFKHFYERRVRRILPALLFVILVSLPFAWLYLLPSSFVDFSKSILYSLGFSSNFYFHYSGQQYGAESGLLKPFLHTWSLSVEEQYYILFPIVLLITFKYFRKYLIHILILGFVLSLGLADWGSRNHPSASFYFLHTRMWELIAGSILAYFEITKGYRSKNITLNLILPFTGLILIGHSILFYDDKMFHPSFYTLSPIIGACLIIWFSSKDELITKILSTKLFVGIGLISYSLYLWHYPIFAFGRNPDGSFFLNKNFCIILAIFISIISYYFIEIPMRKKNNKFLLVGTIIIFFIFFLSLINYYIVANKGFTKRLPNSFKHLRLNSECEIDKQKCNFPFLKDKKIILIGDSYVETLEKSLKKYATYSSGTLIDKMDACNLFPTFYLINNAKIKVCEEEDLIDKDLMLRDKNSIFIIFGALNTYLTGKKSNGKEWNAVFKTSQKKYKDINDAFLKSVKHYSKIGSVILVYPPPEFNSNVPKKLMKNLGTLKEMSDNLKNMQSDDFISIPYSQFKIRSSTSFKILDSIKGKNIFRVYVHDKICGNRTTAKCIAHNNEEIFFYDHHHLSQNFAKMVNEEILNVIKIID